MGMMGPREKNNGKNINKIIKEWRKDII